MILKRGSTGRDVVNLQTALHERHYYGGDHDGMFGPETERAVRNFQIAAGLTPDGVAGPITRAALNMNIVAPRVPHAAVELVKLFEGFRADAYLCPADVWTIGYGHTGSVHFGDVVTEAEAETLLEFDLHHSANIVKKYVQVPLNENQRAALISFVFNVGGAAFQKSTLLVRLNKHEYAAVPSELAKWVRANGFVLDGLKRRRAAEADLWRKVG